ncbi:MAG: NUDIX domain-containing protein [Planctomycetota bacterium]
MLYRFLLTLGHRIALRWPRRRRRQGACVAVWRGAELLVVRHSYEPGWFLPGGAAKRGESLAEAGRRELREETGIEAELDALVPCFTTAWIHVLELCPTRTPEVTVDGREVTEARFADPATVEGLPEYVADYLLSRPIRAPRPAQPGTGSSD